MANTVLAKHAKSVGEYYLIDIDEVLALYKQAGYNTDNDDEEVPNTLEIGGEECFFTGDHVLRGDKYFEIVIAAKGFKWDEVVHDDSEDDFDDEDEDE